LNSDYTALHGAISDDLRSRAICECAVGFIDEVDEVNEAGIAAFIDDVEGKNVKVIATSGACFPAATASEQ
jgi:hypothetical protein